MHVIRPIRSDDLDALVRMAQTAGAGFTSLPPVPEFLQKKIDLSVESFAREVKVPGHERYLFVLEDSDTGLVGGCCAVEAACGLDEPFYNYRVGLTVHASRELNVYTQSPTLYLSNDYTGASVLCSLYLSPEFRGGGNGRLLSKCRFLHMAANPERFDDRVIAEMRGVSDDKGHSPFWEALGRKFFTIDYDRAEHLVGMGNKAFIAELMPKHPVYTKLLAEEAREVIGQVHPHTAPAMHLLVQEGFRMQGYIDIFDGGPTVEAPRSQIGTIAASLCLPAEIGAVDSGRPALVAREGNEDFRCVLDRVDAGEEGARIRPEVAEALGVAAGDSIRISPMNP